MKFNTGFWSQHPKSLKKFVFIINYYVFFLKDRRSTADKVKKNKKNKKKQNKKNKKQMLLLYRKLIK
jgi:hypothetical protein